MYKRWSKSASKRFLLFGAVAFFGGFIISGLLLLAIKSRGDMSFDFSSIQFMLIALACALIPLCSFTGFSVLFVSIDELTPNKSILLIIFCIPLVILMIPFGAVVFLPTTILSLKLIMND